MAFPFDPHSLNQTSKSAVELYHGSSLSLYDIGSGEPYIAIDFPVDDATLSQDGSLLSASSCDAFIYLWNRTSGQLLHELKTEAGRLVDVAFSPDGRLRASSSGDQPIQIWDTSIGQLLHQVSHQTRLNSSPINAFSPDSLELAVATGNKIHIFEAATGTTRRMLENQYNLASELAFLPDIEALFITDGDKVYKADLPNASVNPAEETVFPAVNMASSPDGRLKLGIGPFGLLEMWNRATGQGV